MAEEAKVVEESKEMKFTDEELQSLQSLQTSYQEKQATLGQLAVQKILLNQQIDGLNIRTEEVETEYHIIFVNKLFVYTNNLTINLKKTPK